ncbi:hypothetical protein, partial [Mycobacterium sp. KBS0706]|uniref:hypothetical protein n=1 Tax=Mycobacterium sp. KBS0706 TaxID=2578109 RepID=UPI001C8F87C8
RRHPLFGLGEPLGLPLPFSGTITEHGGIEMLQQDVVIPSIIAFAHSHRGTTESLPDFRIFKSRNSNFVPERTDIIRTK